MLLPKTGKIWTMFFSLSQAVFFGVNFHDYHTNHKEKNVSTKLAKLDIRCSYCEKLRHGCLAEKATLE